VAEVVIIVLEVIKVLVEEKKCKITMEERKAGLVLLVVV
jgi:hypothetical protein